MAARLSQVWDVLRNAAGSDSLAQALLAEKLRRDALAIQIRAAILGSFHLTDDKRYCVRRTDVADAVAKALGEPMANVDLSRRTMEAAIRLGAHPVENRGRCLYVFLRPAGASDEDALRESRALRFKPPAKAKKPREPVKLAAGRPSKALTDLWYGILKKRGFDDIERRETVVEREPYWTQARADINGSYEERARTFLWAHDWRDPYERLVWELHCEGKSVRFIASAAGKTKSLIHRVLQVIQKRAGLGQTDASGDKPHGNGRTRRNRTGSGAD